MSAANLEILLARLYTDARFREAFLSDPEETARTHDLDETEIEALRNIDRNGLEFASRSYARKRESHAARRRSWLGRLIARSLGSTVG
ncbi:MAG: Os1348 family NHLP clan protein [Betaproteobacteria bacterium]|jgi:hypothetical protein|nr:Os1348 family NHLP clan protein [Betaproteobacteria bacterium]